MFTENEVRFLKEQLVARIATVSTKMKPHVVPTCFVFDGTHIFTAADANAKRVHGLSPRPHVCLVIDKYTEDWSDNKALLIQGEAEVSQSGEIFNYAKGLLEKKYPWYLRPNYTRPITQGKRVIIQITPSTKKSWGIDKPHIDWK